MKRTLAMIFALTLCVFAFAGCEKSGNDGTQSDAGSSAESGTSGNGTVNDPAADSGTDSTLGLADGRKSYASSTTPQQRSNGRSLTGAAINGRSASDELRYRQMLENGRVRDTDGFLLDGENTSYDTLR